MRRWTKGVLTGVALMLAGFTPTWAEGTQELAAAAAKKGPVVWYESSTPEEINQVIAAFNKHYPDIKVQYVRNTGGASIAARIIQESQAGATTASFVTADVQQIVPLTQRNLLVSDDWTKLGVDRNLIGSPEAVAVTAPLGVLVWNKNKVDAADVPDTWDGLLDPRWKGRIGTWRRGAMYADLGKQFGAERMREYVKKLVALNPMVYPSTYTVAQQIAAGEIDIAMGLYHTSQPALARNAPIGIKIVSPIPLNTLFGAVVNKGGNQEGAKVLLAWLSTPEGAIAYEKATHRGNPRVPGTEAAKLTAGKSLSEYPIGETNQYLELDRELTEMLSAAGGKP